MAPPGDRTIVEEIEKRTTNITGKRDGISVSAAVRGTSKGKRGFFSKYLRCQLVRCNRLCFLLLNVCVLAWQFAG